MPGKFDGGNDEAIAILNYMRKQREEWENGEEQHADEKPIVKPSPFRGRIKSLDGFRVKDVSAGFTGTKKDKLGREYHYVNGVRVAKNEPEQAVVKPSPLKEKPKPKAKPEQPASEFKKKKAIRGEMGDAKRIDTEDGPKLVMADGSPIPEHLQDIIGKIPPSYTDIKLSLDPNADVLATAIDANGKGKSVYRAGYEMGNADIKFARINEMMKKFPEIAKQIWEARKDPKQRDNADVAWLMAVQGTRPGSEEDTKGLAEHYDKPMTEDMIVENAPAFDDDGEPLLKKDGSPATVPLAIKLDDGSYFPVRDEGAREQLLQAKQTGEGLHDTTYWLKSHGATTLEGRHIVPTEDGGVALRFMGKETVWHDHVVHNPVLAKMLLERKAKAGDHGQLFNTNEKRVNKFMGKLDGGHFSAKDLRTHKGCRMAGEIIKGMETPKDEKSYKNAVKSVGEQVSGVLGNRWEQAVESYIDPALWTVWRNGLNLEEGE